MAGRYRLETLLGRGGMGSVWRAVHVTLGSPVAVKLMDPAIVCDPEAIARFKREAQAAAALRSLHVVQIHDFGVDDGTPYIVMELLEGESLRTRLGRVGRLANADTVRVVAEVARALAQAHARGVVHRDIKPDNIFLARVDHGEVAKVLDFGIAKVASPSDGGAALTRAGSAIGTPRYMAPEQLEGSSVVDARADLWALAIVAFECVVGRAAVTGESIGEIAVQICAQPLPVPSRVAGAAVPPGFDAWFARGAHRSPAERFPSASAMAEALAAVCAPASPEARSLAAADPAGSPALAATLPAAIAPGAPASPGAPSASDSESSPRWSGGGERAGFDVIAGCTTRTLRLRLWGLWDVALANAYRTAILGAAVALEPGGPWVALADARQHRPQKPEVQPILREAMLAGIARGCTRVATVVSQSAVSQMQIRRLFEESRIPNTLFVDVDAALAWIGR